MINGYPKPVLRTRYATRFVRVYFIAIACTCFYSQMYAADIQTHSYPTASHSHTLSANESFAYSLQHSLQDMGITTDTSTLLVYLGRALTPSIDTQKVCLSSGVLFAQETLSPVFTAAFGVTFEQYEVSPASWKKATVRHFVTQRIAEMDSSESILIKGGWATPILGSYWGNVTGIDTNKEITGMQLESETTIRYTPQNIVFLSFTNNSVSPSRRIHELIRETLSTPHSVSSMRESASVISGVAAINRLILYIHRTPVCPECGHRSYICIKDAFATWGKQFYHAAQWLESPHPSLESHQEKQLHRAANVYRELYELCCLVQDLPLRDICAAPHSQLQLLPHLYTFRSKLVEAFNTLAPVIGLTLDNYTDASFRQMTHTHKSASITQNLPLFSHIRNGEYPFLCAALMTGQLASFSDYPEWALGIAGIPACVCVDMHSLAPLYKCEKSYTLKKKMIESQGYSPVCFAHSPLSPRAVTQNIRRRILHSIDKGIPVIGEGFSSTNDVAVIIGYQNYGQTLIARSSHDNKNAFTLSDSLPNVLWIYDKKIPVSTSEEAVANALNFYIKMFESPATNNVYCGRNVLAHMRIRCLDYHASPALISTNFARAHRDFYHNYISQRRNLYRFLEAAATRVPVIAVPLIAAHNCIITQVETLRSALTDDIALTQINGSFWPPAWAASGAIAEAELLKKALKYEEEAHYHMKLALDDLEKLHVKKIVP